MSDYAAALPDFDLLWDYNDPAATEAKFLTLLPQAELTHDRNYHAQLLTQIARAQGLQCRFEEAHGTLDLADLLLAPGMDIARIRYLLERGRVYNSSGSPEQARPFFLDAFALADAVGSPADFYAVDAAHMLAIVGSPQEQMEWNLRAVAMAEASPNERARNWLGSLYNNIGWTQHDAGKYEEALTTFQRALEYRLAQSKPREILIARWCIARTLRSLGKLHDALDMQQALLSEYEKTGEESGYVYEEIAECLLALGNQPGARPYAHKAHALLSADPWFVANESDRLSRLHALGE